MLVYVNAKFQQAFGCSWLNDLTKKLNRARPDLVGVVWRLGVVPAEALPKATHPILILKLM